MSNTKTAEERIYLQLHNEDGEWFGGDGPTWCADMINDTDVEYIRVDISKNNAAEARREALREAAGYLHAHEFELAGELAEAIEQLGDSDG